MTSQNSLVTKPTTCTAHGVHLYIALLVFTRPQQPLGKSAFNQDNNKMSAKVQQQLFLQLQSLVNSRRLSHQLQQTENVTE